MTKYLRILTLAIVGLMVARQYGLLQRFSPWVGELALRPERLLPARTSGRNLPTANGLPNYRPDEPAMDQRQPANTPASQRIGESQWSQQTVKE